MGKSAKAKVTFNDKEKSQKAPSTTVSSQASAIKSSTSMTFQLTDDEHPDCKN